MILYSSILVGRNVLPGESARLFDTPQGRPLNFIGQAPPEPIIQTAEHTSVRLASEMETPIENVRIVGYSAEVILHEGYTASPTTQSVASFATMLLTFDLGGIRAKRIFTTPLFSIVSKRPDAMVYQVKTPILVYAADILMGHISVGDRGFDLGTMQRVKVNLHVEPF